MAQIASPKPAPVCEPLTEREIEILFLAARGLSNKVIGIKLKISDRTVQGHTAQTFKKLQAASRTEAAMCGVSLGLIQLSQETHEHAIALEI